MHELGRPMRATVNTGHVELMARYEAAIEEAEKRADAAERALREHLRRPPDEEAKSLYADGVSTWWIARLLGLPRGVVRGRVVHLIGDGERPRPRSPPGP